MEPTRVQSQRKLPSGCSLPLLSSLLKRWPNTRGGAHVRRRRRDKISTKFTALWPHELTKLKIELSSSQLPSSTCFAFPPSSSNTTSIFCLPAALPVQFTTYPTNPYKALHATSFWIIILMCHSLPPPAITIHWTCCQPWLW